MASVAGDQTAMGARILDGNVVAERIKREAAERAQHLAKSGIVPGLAAVLVGSDPASHTYVSSKVKTCAELGLFSEKIERPAETTTEELLALVESLNKRPDIHGILVQMPLPKHIDTNRIINAIDPRKDVDGFHPVSFGRLALKQDCFAPCTPSGIIRLLDHYQISLKGARVVVLGRSHTVGLPMALLTLHRDATVTICNSKTQDIEKISSQADILIAAMGRAGGVQADWIKEGAVVIDVGINRITTELEARQFYGDDQKVLDQIQKKGFKLIGDVHPLDVRRKASAYTPVPGGVGPLTIAMLMNNTVIAAERISN